MKNKNTNDRWNASHYKEHSSPQFKGALEILNKYPWHGDETILDIGCGDGKITALVAEQVPHGTVVGIDASANMIEECRRTFGHIKNLSFVCAPAETYIVDQPFDLVISFFAFHWIADKLKVFQNIHQMLKDGGKLIIKTAGGNSTSIEEVFERVDWKTQLAATEETWHGKSGAQEYEKMLSSAGFKHIKIDVIEASQFFANTEDFIGYAMGWVPHVTGLPHEKALAFSRDLAENVRARMKVKDPADRIELLTPIACIYAERA